MAEGFLSLGLSFPGELGPQSDENHAVSHAPGQGAAYSGLSFSRCALLGHRTGTWSSLRDGATGLAVGSQDSAQQSEESRGVIDYRATFKGSSIAPLAEEAARG